MIVASAATPAAVIPRNRHEHDAGDRTFNIDG
jgi:hypothetical protein